MDFKVKPYQHQLDAIQKSTYINDMALFWEMGTGKTGGMINILRLKYATHERLLRTLILGPVAVVYNWKREFSVHSKIHQSDVIVAEGTGSSRVAKLKETTQEKNKILIMNYEALRNEAIYGYLLKVWKPEIIVCDESHLVKNPKAQQAKRVHAISVNALYRFILTGTPILNSPQDIFMQYKILDNGATFGSNFFVFRNTYFRDENSLWANRPNHFPKYVPIQEKYPELTAKIFSKATRILKDECLDLPPRIEQVYDVEMNTEQIKAYNTMKRDFIAWIKDQKTGENKASVAQLAVTKALRLQQIVCGFATTDDGSIVDFGSIPRLDAVREILEQIVENHKVIIWCSFVHNYSELSKLCTKLNLKHVFITGEQSAKEKQNAIEDFETKKEVRVVIANRRAGGTGINLVQASYSIVYSRNFSLAEEEQSKDRNHRGGSQIHDRVVKIDLCARGTIDELCLQALRNKRNIADQILNLTGEEL